MFDKVKKFKVGDEEFTFKITNKTILKVDETFDNYGKVIDGLMQGKQFYTNALRLLCCSCIEKEFTLEELADQLTPEQMNLEMPDFAVNLYFDYIGINKEESEPTVKNQTAQPKKVK